MHANNVGKRCSETPQRPSKLGAIVVALGACQSPNTRASEVRPICLSTAVLESSFKDQDILPAVVMEALRRLSKSSHQGAGRFVQRIVRRGLTLLQENFSRSQFLTSCLLFGMGKTIVRCCESYQA
jgi:hypothetical protein